MVGVPRTRVLKPPKICRETRTIWGVRCPVGPARHHQYAMAITNLARCSRELKSTTESKRFFSVIKSVC